MKALGYYIIIDEIKESVKETKGGLLLSEKAREDIRYRQATVESVGSACEDHVKPGDTIWFDRVAGNNIEFANGDIRKVIKISDVIIVE